MEILQTSQNDLAGIVATVKAIKRAVIESRFVTAKLVNREVLTLYYNIGRFISERSRTGNWGTGAISCLSDILRQEMPGLRGFSETNIKNMRLFYEAWCGVFENRQLTTADLIADSVRSEPMTTEVLDAADVEAFFAVAFTHHREIIRMTDGLDERMFFVKKCASEFWQIKKLKYHLKEGLYRKEIIGQNNFSTQIDSVVLRRRALETFKNNYVFDFVEVDEDVEFVDEKVLEREIVANIRNFIMAFGSDFAFMGNQYRLTVDEHDYFVDLLFYHRGLRCLVAVELKSGEFKAPYMGQMNLYLTALDEYVKRADENPSIGIILCREKSDKIVEFAFRNVSSPMGVATYSLRNELPAEYVNALPNPEDLRKLL